MPENKRENSPTEISYQRVRQFVYKIIRRRIRYTEDAEDLTQTVMLRGWQSTERNADYQIFETEEDYLRYFSVIAINEVKRFQSEQLKINIKNISEQELLDLPAGQLSPYRCLEIIDTICQLPLKQRLALILGQRKLLRSFQTVFSIETIADLLEIDQTLLEKLANEIPLSDKEIKYVIETLSDKELKTSVRDERWKARKLLEKFIYRQ